MILGAGAQFITPSSLPEAARARVSRPRSELQHHQLGLPADKSSKDNNYRAIAVHDNVIYYTKGSGGNGVNTVYFVDTTGKACPNGVGLPEPGAQLPTSPPSFTVSGGGPGADQHVHPEGVPDQPGDIDHDVPVRHVVRQRPHAVRRRRGQRRQPATRRPPGSTPTRPRRRSRLPGFRSGCSRRARGTSPTRCRRGWTSASRTPCLVIRPATTRRRAFPGRPPPMACGH